MSHLQDITGVPTTVEEATKTNPFLAEAMRVGMTNEEIICFLSANNEALQRRLLRLSMISPTRLKLPDGREMIWRCPARLVPFEDLT